MRPCDGDANGAAPFAEPERKARQIYPLIQRTNPNRKLVPLADYDAAHDEVSSVGTILGLLALVPLLLIADAALIRVGQNVPPGPDRWWTAIFAPSLVMAIGSPVVLWLVGAFRRNIGQTSILVCPTCQQLPWSFRAVRLTGCCDRCGDPMLELPKPRGPIAQSANELSKNYRGAMSGMIGFAVAGLASFGLGIVLFCFTGRFTHLMLGTAAFFVVFIPGLFLVERRSKRQTFECPNCKVDLRKDPKTIPWISTTGRCVKCAHIALDVEEPLEAESKLSLAKLRKRQDFRGQSGFGLLLLSFTAAPLFLATLGFAGVPARVAFRCAMWCVLPLLAALMWRVAPLGLQDRCPLCRRSTSGFEAIVIATRKCPHCVGLIAELTSAPAKLLGPRCQSEDAVENS